jgi:hypothetical protein
VTPVGRLLAVVLLVLAVAAPAGASADEQAMDWSAPLQLDPGSSSRFSGGSGIDCAEDLCVAAGAEGRILVSTDPTGGSQAWEEVAVEEASAGNLRSVSCSRGAFCAAVDDAGHLFTSTEPDGGAGAWSSAAIDPGHEIGSISCPSAGFCAAIDDAGQVLVSDEPDGGAGAWSASAPVDGEPRQISCASASLCALAYDGSNPFYDPPGLLVSTDPLAGAGSWVDSGVELSEGGGRVFGVSCPSEDFCALAYHDGILVSDEPAGGGSTWHLTQSHSEATSPSLSQLRYVDGLGITCASASFCVAQLNIEAGKSDYPNLRKLLISTEPASSGSWTIETMNPEWSFGVPWQVWFSGGMVCTDPTFCATVAPAGWVSTATDPAGGSTAWHLAATGSAGPTLTSVACPTRSFCAATGTQGRLYTSLDPTDPAGWTATPLAETVESVTCSSSTWCTVAATGPGGPAVMYATEPAAGAGAWTAVARPTGRTLACPEPGFCAQLADYDEVLASDDPLSGAGSWVSTDMQLSAERLGPPFLRALSCPSANLCAAGGSSNGRILASADPTAGRSSWISAYVGEVNPNAPNVNPQIGAIDCPRTSFCAATVSGGVETTSAPLAGNSAWKLSSTSSVYLLGPISCAGDASLCVAIDGQGNALTSRFPQDEPSGWGNLEPVYEGEGLSDVSCALDGSLCAVISRDGEAIVGTQNPFIPPSGAGSGEKEGPPPGGTPNEPFAASPPPPCPKAKSRKKARRGPALARGHKVRGSRVPRGGRRGRSPCG